MCFMSVVHDYHKKLEPDYWTPKKIDYFRDLFRDLLKDAERYDEQTGQKDCLDPKKAEFLKDVEKRSDGFIVQCLPMAISTPRQLRWKCFRKRGRRV